MIPASRGGTRTAFLALTVILLAGCASPDGRTSPSTGAAPAPERIPDRTLSLIMRAEPRIVLDATWDRSAVHQPLFNAGLGAWNQQGIAFPLLAEGLPQLNSASWTVAADGRMETSYRLRPNLVWHDGAPLDANDFVFTYASSLARVEWGLDQSSAGLRTIDEVVALDPRTVLIRWKRPFPEAAAPDIFPVARHLLEEPLRSGDREAYGNHQYWTTEFVGSGPFRLDRWERGAFIEGSAFDSFALGRPGISRIRLTWNNDPNVTLTRLLAGDGDIALDGSIRFDQVRVLRERWRERGTILLSPTSLRYTQVQARADYASPRSLLDVRVRRALMHAIDRTALADAMLDEPAMAADTVPPPTVPYFPALQRAIRTYPFDVRRSEQLMSEAGWSKGPDGVFGHPTEGRFRLDVRGVSGGAEEQDTTIVAGFLDDAGFDPTITLLPASARAVDDRMKGTFPGLSMNDNSLARGLGLNKWLTANVGGPETNWVGGNRMGWSNSDFDRIYELWTGTLDPGQAAERMIEMMRIMNEEMPSLPLYYQFQVVAHAAPLRGPEPFTPDSTRYANVHEWAWR
jgi:peptide/nickel transport system substrate-binding protein